MKKGEPMFDIEQIKRDGVKKALVESLRSIFWQVKNISDEVHQQNFKNLPQALVKLKEYMTQVEQIYKELETYK